MVSGPGIGDVPNPPANTLHVARPGSEPAALFGGLPPLTALQLAGDQSNPPLQGLLPSANLALVAPGMDRNEVPPESASIGAMPAGSEHRYYHRFSASSVRDLMLFVWILVLHHLRKMWKTIYCSPLKLHFRLHLRTRVSYSLLMTKTMIRLHVPLRPMQLRLPLLRPLQLRLPLLRPPRLRPPQMRLCSSLSASVRA